MFKSKKHKKFRRRGGLESIRFCLQPSNLPGKETRYYAYVHGREKLNIGQIFDRIMARGSELRRETFEATFSITMNEIIRAAEQGFDVDFGLGELRMLVNGAFDGPNDDFDPKRHTIEPHLLPGYELYDLASELKAQNEGLFKSQYHPWIEFVTAKEGKPTSDEWQLKNNIPAGHVDHLTVYGKYLRIQGDNPENGITLHYKETHEKYHYGIDKMLLNSTKMVMFTPNIDFTPGEWELTLTTQYSRTQSTLLKNPRSISRIFEVKEGLV